MQGLFSDSRHLQFLLEAEAALATTEAKLGLIPQNAATEIVKATKNLKPDFARLRQGIENDGFPIIALVQQLREELMREHVSAEAANFVHWGATTQDIVDTANVLQAKMACNILTEQLKTCIAQLAQLTKQHRATLMAGRTHSQQALPITFGFKVAGWLAPLLRHHARLQELQPRVFVLQFGGAVGTLASLANNGLAVQTALAAELKLQAAIMPWHTQRDGIAELANWLSMLNGSLAKMAQDILLLCQTEIAELRESNDATRGGSSTMPQKSNPILSEQILAAARTNANLLASIHQAMPQEQERGTHGWQMEWLALPQMFGLASGALEKTIFLSQNLVVNTNTMQEHIDASQGLMLAEAFTFALAEHLPHKTAKALVQEAVQRCIKNKTHLRHELKTQAMHAQPNLEMNWDAVTEKNYLGSSNQIISQVLEAAERILHE